MVDGPVDLLNSSLQGQKAVANEDGGLFELFKKTMESESWLADEGEYGNDRSMLQSLIALKELSALDCSLEYSQLAYSSLEPENRHRLRVSSFFALSFSSLLLVP